MMILLEHTLLRGSDNDCEETLGPGVAKTGNDGRAELARVLVKSSCTSNAKGSKSARLGEAPSLLSSVIAGYEEWNPSEHQ